MVGAATWNRAIGAALAAGLAWPRPVTAAEPVPTAVDRVYDGPTSYTGRPAAGPQPPPAEPAPPPPAPAPEPAADEAPADEAMEVDPVELLRARAFFRAGGILLGTGLLLSAGAIAMGASDPCAKGSGNNCHVGARNRAALAMGVPGIAVVAAGVTFLSLGGVLRRRARIGVAASARGAGVSWSMAF